MGNYLDDIQTIAITYQCYAGACERMGLKPDDDLFLEVCHKVEIGKIGLQVEEFVDENAKKHEAVKKEE